MQRNEHSELKELVAEASQALARLDTGRLEELALSCQSLNRELSLADVERRRALEREARESAHRLAVFARVLEATRANLNVIDRMRKLRASRPEFGYGLDKQWTRMENRHGDN